jgi:hypothetical protein
VRHFTSPREPWNPLCPVEAVDFQRWRFGCTDPFEKRERTAQVVVLKLCVHLPRDAASEIKITVKIGIVRLKAPPQNHHRRLKKTFLRPYKWLLLTIHPSVDFHKRSSSHSCQRRSSCLNSDGCPWNYTLRFFFSTFGYFFGSEMGIVLFGRAFYLVDVTSTIVIKSRKGSQQK